MNQEKLSDILELLFRAKNMKESFGALTEDEITEQQLFCLIKAKDELKRLVIETDPHRFGPVMSNVLTEQEMKKSRLNLCTICGHTRCQSDHK